MFPYTYSVFIVDRVSLSVTTLLRRVRFKRRSSDLPCHSGHDNCFVRGECSMDDYVMYDVISCMITCGKVTEPCGVLYSRRPLQLVTVIQFNRCL